MKPAARGGSIHRDKSAAGRARSTITVVLAIAWLIIAGAPIYYMLVVSFEPASEFLDGNPWFPGGGVTLENYSAALSSGFWMYLGNSVVVGVGSTVLAVTISLMAAYAIVRRTSRLTNFMFRFFLIGFAVPIQALMIPLYIEVQRLHIYDTLIGLVLPIAAFALPLSIFILANFLREIPHELIEAMELDGAGAIRLLRSLIAPLALPAMMTVIIYNLILAWNNFLFPLILTQSNERATLPLAVFNFQGRNFSNVPNIMASVFLATLPLLLLYLVARRHIVTALSAGFSK